MTCKNCGTELTEGTQYCTACGAEQNIAENPQTAYTPTPQYFAPALQLPTNRSLLKMFFLSLITFGIYGIVIWTKIAGEINITASRYDGKRTCPYFATLFLTMITYGIFAFVWQHKFTSRVGAEVKRRGYNYNFGTGDFWLWCVLGSLIIVGPFIYCHKLMKSMNMINASFNIYG